ncbi:MAG: SAM-dependent methyltransferase [Rhodobacteraceae bacterium]|nr:SAM-dependent methyltransferase [Paracoccaceae bacterium]MAY46075.1 SAM-dependent methyltransferase [Paracoccaceae bacterium]
MVVARGMGWRLDRLIAAPRFQELAARLPFCSAVARRDGGDIFDILQGFVASQVLGALVELGLLRRLLDAPAPVGRLALWLHVPADRLEVLLRAGVALRLLHQRRDGRFALARRGAAILGVPGLEAMILHNRAFYRDLADPATLLRGEGPTELARFWPYVLGAPGEGGVGAVDAERYCDLMAQSQVLVAQDTLRQVPLRSVSVLMDLGGGTGAFLEAALRQRPRLEAMLVDLPEVIPGARDRFDRAGLRDRITLWPQSFRDGPLPGGADAVSLVRVLYDHDDETVRDLLARVFEALPPGGRLILSEPMSGRARPDRATDVYFAFYTMAMGTGRVRSARQLGAMCRAAGFHGIKAPRPRRPYITSVLTCVKPG